ncbi:hypothetical protein ACFQLX_05415 [Streptomyces polyrhachis]|uniref:Uncharacterized protein n=1 Tax=Streptomyces polyrhachis TaxID=1282885 RepID=A0ABW2G9X9_9ACTN
MLDDISVLRVATAGYRAAATAAGLPWPDLATPPPVVDPPEQVHRIFAVERIPEQLTWLHSQGWQERRLLPNGGWLLPWPTDPDEALGQLSLSVGVPFPWRQQLPLFHFEFLIYTFVLGGEHEGQIWRYEISPDAWDAVRAAPSLAALFTEWTKGLEVGVVYLNDLDGCLAVGEPGRRAIDTLLEHTPGLDPLAFPVSMPEQPVLRQRQTECGVDMDRVGPAQGFESFEALGEEIEAVRATLDL